MSRTRLIAAIATVSLIGADAATAADKSAQINTKAHAALASLYEKAPVAKALSAKAVAILVFPEITKVGFVVGGQHGDGALFKGEQTVGYYSTSGASFGLEAGAQTYGYALFFMNAKALQQLDSAEGFEVGVGANAVVIDQGAAGSLTTTTAKDDIYAFVFGQKGLMAGVSIKGNKISKTHSK